MIFRFWIFIIIFFLIIFFCVFFYKIKNFVINIDNSQFALFVYIFQNLCLFPITQFLIIFLRLFLYILILKLKLLGKLFRDLILFTFIRLISVGLLTILQTSHLVLDDLSQIICDLFVDLMVFNALKRWKLRQTLQNILYWWHFIHLKNR